MERQPIFKSHETPDLPIRPVPRHLVERRIAHTRIRRRVEGRTRTTDRMNPKPATLIPIWSAYPTLDEYGKLGNCLAHFTSEPAALQAAKGKGWFGGNGAVVTGYAIEVDGKTYLLKTDKPTKLDRTYEDEQRLRFKALKKLKPEERSALGYPPNKWAELEQEMNWEP